MPRFEYKDKSSHKFWEIQQKGKKVEVRFGKVGNEGQKKVKDLGNKALAIAEYDKLIKAKKKKGYAPAGKKPSAPPPPTFPRDLKQEAEIEKTPSDVDQYLVYADWLETQGDPRGQLIEVQAQLLNKPGDKSLSALERSLFKKHKEHFFGPAHETDFNPNTVPQRDKRSKGDVRRRALPKVCWSFGYFKEIDWYCGYVQHLHFDTGYYGEGKSGEDSVEILLRFLQTPSARFIQHLSLGDIWADESDYMPNMTLVIEALGSAPCSEHLKHLEFRGGENAISGVILDASKLSKACPNLEELRLYGGSITLGKPNLPQLRSLSVWTGGLDKGAVRSISKANWPKLESLQLLFGEENYGANVRAKDLSSILQGNGLSKVKHLGLCNATFADDLCRALPKAEILPQLQTLDLSMGIMTEKGARALLKSAGRFAHLKQLDLMENYIPEDMHKDLKKLCAEVLVEGQKDEEDEPEYRYTSVSE